MELQQKCLTDQTDGLTRLAEKELFSALPKNHGVLGPRHSNNSVSK